MQLTGGIGAIAHAPLGHRRARRGYDGLALNPQFVRDATLSCPVCAVEQQNSLQDATIFHCYDLSNHGAPDVAKSGVSLVALE
jgi:hypothetical protein